MGLIQLATLSRESLLVLWPSDVESLNVALLTNAPPLPERRLPPVQLTIPLLVIVRKLKSWTLVEEIVSVVPAVMRSEERRAGKECRSGRVRVRVRCRLCREAGAR